MFVNLFLSGKALPAFAPYMSSAGLFPTLIYLIFITNNSQNTSVFKLYKSYKRAITSKQ